MIRLTGMVLFALFLVGCNDKVGENIPAQGLGEVEQAIEVIEDSTTKKEKSTVNYVCPFDSTIKVEFSSDGETATLYDQADNVFTLTIAPAASGAYYVNQNKGVTMHVKDDDGIFEFVKDKFISCTVWKGELEPKIKTTP